MSTPDRASKLRRAAAWGDVRGRRLGMLAYALNRLTGIGLVAYLYLHLAVLSLLAGGPDAWDPFVQLARSPAFLALDVILIAGWLIHGLNGIRVTLTGLGIGTRSQKAMFVGLMTIAVVGLAAMALAVFGGSA
jgi:succinate dehydrogenase / fumarate reductase cytochrome b subunit